MQFLIRWIGCSGCRADLPVKNFTAANTVVYDTGRVEDYNSWLLTGNALSLKDEVGIYRKVKGSAESAENIIWTDAFETPILWSVSKENKLVYYLGTHFNPAWSELVWSENFPEILMDLFYSEPDSNASSKDTRIIDQQQVKNIPLSGKQPGIEKNDAVPLSQVCWSLVFLLFLAERIVSFKTITR